MNLSDAERLIETYTQTHWTLTPIAYPMTLPVDQASPGVPILPTGDEDYLALRHLFRTSSFITVPGTCRRVYGQVHLTECVRAVNPTLALRDYADVIMDLYEGTEIIDGVTSNILRLWTLTGSSNFSFAGWNTREMVFGASFERYKS